HAAGQWRKYRLAGRHKQVDTQMHAACFALHAKLLTLIAAAGFAVATHTHSSTDGGQFGKQALTLFALLSFQRRPRRDCFGKIVNAFVAATQVMLEYRGESVPVVAQP